MTDLESLFPNLQRSAYRVTSPSAEAYNCLAWAAGRDDEWWDPAPRRSWPDDVPRQPTIENLIRVFEHVGFVCCDDGGLEAGFEKIAIYGDENEYEHAAKQLPSGKWTSKLGADEDIEHETTDALEGVQYGRVLRFMKRRVADAT